MLEIKYFSQLGSAGNVQIICNDSAISLTAFITFNFSFKLRRNFLNHVLLLGGKNVINFESTFQYLIKMI